MTKRAGKKTKRTGEPEIDPRFVPVVIAFAKARDVRAGKLFSSFGLKVKGKIFAMLGRGQFVVKLPRERVDVLVSTGRGERFDPGHGRLMKEWVVVKIEPSKWVEVAREAYDFVKQGKA